MASWTFRNLALNLAAFLVAGHSVCAAAPPANKPKPKPQLKAISPSQAKTDKVQRAMPVGVDPGLTDNSGSSSPTELDDLSDAPPALPPAQPWTDKPKPQPQWQTNVQAPNMPATKPSTAFPSEDMIPDFNKPFPSAANQATQSQTARPAQPVYPQFQQLPPEQPVYPQFQQQMPQQPVYPQFTQTVPQQPIYPQYQQPVQQVPMQQLYPQYQQMPVQQPYPQFSQQVPMQAPMQQSPMQQPMQQPIQQLYPQFQQPAQAYPQFQQPYAQFQQPPMQQQMQKIYPQFTQQAPVQQPYPQLPPQMKQQAASTQNLAPAKKPGPQTKKTVSDAERVSRMEKAAFGKIYSQEEVSDRVDRLETKMFGKPQDGAVHQRISVLEKTLKVSSSGF